MPRCMVGYINRDGTGAITYVHNDGQPQEGVGATLQWHWQDDDMVQALVDHGDISVLRDATSLDDVRYYDDNDFYPLKLSAGDTPVFERDWHEAASAWYVYLLTPDGWFVKRETGSDSVRTNEGQKRFKCPEKPVMPLAMVLDDRDGELFR